MLSQTAGCFFDEKTYSLNPIQKNIETRKLVPIFLAQREGFEPPETLVSTVFKTAAIDHSTISAKYYKIVSIRNIFKTTAKLAYARGVRLRLGYAHSTISALLLFRFAHLLYSKCDKKSIKNCLNTEKYKKLPKRRRERGVLSLFNIQNGRNV